MPEVLADHLVANAATAAASPKLAWQLDHAAPNQTQEAQLLKHRVSVSGDNELTSLFR